MNTAVTGNTLALERCVVRDTAARRGRTRAVPPGATSAVHLLYVRVILGAAAAPLSFSTGTHETGLIALKGSATIVAAGRTFELAQYDALYTPRDCSVEVRPGSAGCDVAEVSAPV